MNPFLPADQQIDVLTQITNFREMVGKLLAENTVDAESRLSIEDLLSTLETTAKAAVEEQESLVSDLEKQAASIRAELENPQELPPRPDDLPREEEAPAPQVTVNPDLGFQLGREILIEHGYLTRASQTEEDLRTIREWVQESISLAASVPVAAAEVSPPLEATAAPPVTPVAPVAPPASPAGDPSVSAHLDLSWTTWLQSAHASLASRKTPPAPESREELWRDIFK